MPMVFVRFFQKMEVRRVLRCSLRSAAWPRESVQTPTTPCAFVSFRSFAADTESLIFGELAAQGITAGYREGFGVTFGFEHGDMQGEPSQAVVVCTAMERMVTKILGQRNLSHTGHQSSFRTRLAVVDRLKALLRCRGQMLIGKI